MTIQKRESGKLVVQFGARWEQAYLRAMYDNGKEWEPFFLRGVAQAVGHIHTRTYQIKLQKGRVIENELEVLLRNT